MSPVNANPGEYAPSVGLDNLCIALVTQDDANGYTADTPEPLAPSADASFEPSTSSDPIYADDQVWDVLVGEGPDKVNLTVLDLPAEMRAKVLGMAFDASTGRVYDNGGTPPLVALSFRSMKSNGKYRYYQYLKGRFEKPREEKTTKNDKSDTKMVKLVFTAFKTVRKFNLGSISDGVKKVTGDEDTTNFAGTTWFNQVQVPAVTAPSALALSAADPVDGATAVAVGKVITLTFNNSLLNSAISNVTLVNDATQAVVAGTNTLDTTKKVITVGHVANLAAATKHLIVVSGVRDVYGQTISQVIDFTTA